MASCPNIKSQEWKDLVKEVGEFKAYALFVQNKYEIPSDYNRGVKVSDFTFDQQKEVETLKSITELREKALESFVNKLNIFSKNEKYKKSLRKTINEFTRADVGKGILLMIKKAEHDIAWLSKQMDASKNDLDVLKNVREFAGAYEIIIEMAKLLQDSPYKDYINVKNRVDNIIGKVESFNEKYLNYSRTTIAESLANESTIKRNEYKNKFAREYEQLHPRPKGQLKQDYNYDIAKNKYVSGKLSDIKDQILNEERLYIYQLLKTGPKDISALSAQLTDPRNIKDQVLQLAVKLLDNADFRANDKFVKAHRDAISKWQSFVDNQRAKGVVITNQKELYGDILEKDEKGNPTGFYTRPLALSYYEDKKEMWAKYEESKLKVIDEINDLRIQISANKASFATQKELGKQVQALIKTYTIHMKRFKAKYLIDYEDGNIDNVRDIKSEFKSKQFEKLKQDSERFEMYNYFIKFNNESDALVAYSQKLEYKLPSIGKKFNEKITDNTLKDGGKRLWQELTSFTEDETAYGELDSDGNTVKVLRSQSGKTYNTIAVPFRATMKPENQSFDLMGMALSNRFVSLNYHEKSLIKTDLEVINDLLHARNIKEVSSTGKKIVGYIKNFQSVTDEEQAELQATIEGKLSNVYKAYNSVLEDRLYGKHNIPSQHQWVDKLAQHAIGFSADMMLVANLMGGTANVLAGKTMNFLESTRRMHYSKNDLIAAERKYWGDLHKIAGDWESLAPKSKTNLLIERFLDSSVDFDYMTNNLTKDSRIKRAFGKHTLYSAQKMGEHYIHSTVTYACMNNIKIMQDGKYITKDGSLTDNRAEGIGMDLGYGLDASGLLTWKNKDWTVEGFDKFSSKVEETVRRKIKDVTADLQGQYDSKNKAMIERTVHGKLLLFLRRWMVRGVERRYKGINNISKDLQDLETHEIFYSEAQQEWKEGTYVSYGRFIKSMITSLKEHKMQTWSVNYSKLSDLEKANIRAARAEILIMTGCFVASQLLANMAGEADDDEERTRLYALAYLTRRNYGELLFYLPVLNPREATRLIRTPSATLSTFEGFADLTDQLLEDIFINADLERYERGRHKDDSKSYILLQKTFNPFFKQIVDKDVENSYNYLKGLRN